MTEIEKANGQVVRVDWTDYGGRRLVDARIWYEDPDGEWHPTRRGLCLTPAVARQVAEAILELLAADAPPDHRARVEAAVARWEANQ